MTNPNITSIEGIGIFGNMTQLHVGSTQITALPADFADLSSLEDLYLSGNQLTTLSKSFGNLINLWSLSFI